MLDGRKIGAFIAARRRETGLTQAEMAERLSVSYQAVSKWENGAVPGAEMLLALSRLFHITVDELLAGREAEAEALSYRSSGVDVAYTDALKREMAGLLRTEDARVLNGLGPFASLYELSFPEISDPVLVLKAEEPGSKQKLAMEYGYAESVCHDMINHLVNDMAVMGARPLAVLDTIVCGSAEKETIRALVRGIADACRENECSLVGGETSVQPQVVEKGVYVLTASAAGIVSKSAVLDGSRVRAGDVVLAAASNGLHTNGYSLVRLLMEKTPSILTERVGGESFIEAIMRPHLPYYKAIKTILPLRGLRAMAHITGGGIAGNLCRVIPAGLSAGIDLSRLRTLPIFRLIRAAGRIRDEEMLATFNCGVGLCVVVSPEDRDEVIRRMSPFCGCYEIGSIREGGERVIFENRVRWE